MPRGVARPDPARNSIDTNGPEVPSAKEQAAAEQAEQKRRKQIEREKRRPSSPALPVRPDCLRARRVLNSVCHEGWGAWQPLGRARGHRSRRGAGSSGDLKRSRQPPTRCGARSAAAHAARLNHQPGAAELPDVLTEDGSRRIVDVVVARLACVGDLQLAVGSLRRTRRLCLASPSAIGWPLVRTGGQALAQAPKHSLLPLFSRSKR